MVKFFEFNLFTIKSELGSYIYNFSGFLPQNVMILLTIATVNTKCDVYYKIRRYTVFYKIRTTQRF